MKNIYILLFAAFISLNSYSQMRRQGMNMNRIPQTNTEPSEREIEKRKKEMEERKAEYITNFLTTLEADDFQKEIIKQYINSFYDAKLALLKTRFEHNLAKKEAITKLENSHFKALEELISANDMAKIKTLITGGFDEKEVVKKKKRKRKRKKKKNKS